MLDRTQKLDAVALLLQRIVGRGGALDRDLGGLELEGLLGLGREDERPAHDQRGADVLAGDLVVIIELAPLKHDLQRFEAAAVVELGKAEVLHVAHGPDPSADRDLLPVEGGGVGVNARDFLAFHFSLVLSLCRPSRHAYFPGAKSVP